jgi:predicted Fe-S protein YdhL (DUF1289 family)
MLDESFTYCIGCYRSRKAIASWSKATDKEKLAFLKEAKQFRQAAKAGHSGGLLGDNYTGS